MLAAVFDRYGPPEVVHLAERPLPEPGPGELRVRVAATVVGRADVAGRAGSPFAARLFFGLRRPKRETLGTDFAGVVDAIGPLAPGEERRFSVGDRVHGFTGPHGGANAEFAVVSGDAPVVATPDRIDDVTAAALVEGYLTALPFVRDVGRVASGDRVLVIGAAGSVGSAAVQLAKHAGATVTGVASTPKLALVRGLGADSVVDYTIERYDDVPGAYHFVFDAVGVSSFGRMRRALAPGGVYATTAPALSVLAVLGPITRLLRGKRAAVHFTGLLPAAAKLTDLRAVTALVADGTFVPLVDRVVPFADIVEAHRRVDTGRKRGAVVVAVDRRLATTTEAQHREAGGAR
ncbi:NAD(P)-dependent alcohol dehydrogenase [Agromyces protaetiae]|nr:NAD(P)-dependent alcohol dehydrogenase [Agromyces protaetiae]